jgi:EAL domain-containing protein (putative c-di-GMP-specific phosphodiesterase class I)
VKLIIDIAHLLGATVTAEGIETHDDAAILASLGSDTLQGYYFARPMAPEDLVSRTTATVN